ncbi:MAG: carboxymuconolactone decarboxylase family protein [Undibacterium sp.]|nr:carboxymuconolactone decarboxylase family protein [Undibacterium sp.]
MNRISVPSTEQTPAASLPFLAAVQKQLGVTPNLMKLLGHSPSALEAYLSLSGTLGKGSIDARTGERIALAIAQFNSCDYCLAAHSYLAANLAKLDSEEILANRRGHSTDVKADAAVRFAITVAQERGHASDTAVQAVKDAGYTEAQILEIVLHVALNTLTNYVNSVARTPVDFPAAAAL